EPRRLELETARAGFLPGAAHGNVRGQGDDRIGHGRSTAAARLRTVVFRAFVPGADAIGEVLHFLAVAAAGRFGAQRLLADGGGRGARTAGAAGRVENRSAAGLGLHRDR